MTYREIQPHPQLRPWVHCYWDLAGRDAEIQPIYPDGRPEMVFHYGDPFRFLERKQERALFVGQMAAPVTLRPSGVIGAFGVRFTPAGVWAFLRSPQSETADKILALDDVCGQWGRQVVERMVNAISTAERVAVIEHALCARTPLDTDCFGDIPRLILAGIVSSREARIGLAIRERQWERVFQQRVGIRPKLLERIGRFRRALSLAGGGLAWVDIADTCGYADQAHLARDFRQFTGNSPTRATVDLFA